MKFIAAFAVFFLAFSNPSFADWWDREPESYSVKNPPEAGSSAEIKDYETLHQYQESRSKEECQDSRDTEYPNFSAFWETVFPRYLDRVGEKSPFTAAEVLEFKPFISKVMRYSDKVTDHFKEKYQRVRPYDQDPSLKPCAFKPGGRKSYPSSHTSDAFAAACVLADRYPDSKKLLMEYAKYLGDLRVIGGVHHPSDIVAGKSLGLQICKEVIRQ